MARIQVRLTEGLYEPVSRMAEREDVSRSDIVRRALDAYLAARPAEVRRRALAAAGSLRSDVTDLSARHDDYLVEACFP